MNPQNPSFQPPSLLEAQSRGGEVNESGLDFQMNVLLAMVPEWLAKEGFSMLIREAMGDFEAQFFMPGRGTVKEFLEAKDHQVTPSEFWEEIARFKSLDSTANGEFAWFTLVSTGLSQSLHPLINGLRRLINPYDFYGPESVIIENSYLAFEQTVTGLGQPPEDADFIFRKVRIDPEWNIAKNYGQAAFRDQVCRHLPLHAELPVPNLDRVYQPLYALIKERSNQPVKRIEIEAIFGSVLPKEKRAEKASISVHTVADGAMTPPPNDIVFRWERFFGNNGRNYPAPEEWNGGLVKELLDTRNWITKNRSSRRIALNGNRRLSSALAFGSIFSAVAGFSIEMVGREGRAWLTDDYPREATPAYELSSSSSLVQKAEDLVVSIGIPRDISMDVNTAIARLGLVSAPRLHLHGKAPILSAAQANSVVSEFKARISEAIAATEAKMIHLFIASPAFVALLLGHRLNAIAPVQCYEWIEANSYVPTCQLR